ncbi:MAG TPA: hypothetical protein DD435_14170 [Cyanobacteria bacterium UBA8530]|nr:hypothetical protein [Cyanobacteria bacterium UBA8530]
MKGKKMKKEFLGFRVFRFVPLALAFSLIGGCSLLAPTFPGLDLGTFLQNLPVSAAQKTFAIQSVQDLAAQVQVEDDHTAAELISDVSINTLALPGFATEGLRSPESRLKDLKEHFRDRLTQKQHGMTIQKTEVTNPDGSIDKTVTMEKTGANSIWRQVVRHFVDGKMVLVTASYRATHKNGMTMESTRIKKIETDDSYVSTFDSKITLKDGRTKTAHWVRTGNADGSEVSSVGTLVRFDGKTLQVTITKTVDGTTTSKVLDGVAVEVSQEEGSPSLDVTVTDPKSGESEKTTITLPNDDQPIDPSQG